MTKKMNFSDEVRLLVDHAERLFVKKHQNNPHWREIKARVTLSAAKADMAKYKDNQVEDDTKSDDYWRTFINIKGTLIQVKEKLEVIEKNQQKEQDGSANWFRSLSK